MPSQTRPLTQAVNKDVEKKRLSIDYFVEKGATANQDGDVHLQREIWNFIRSFPNLDPSEIEVDISNGAVTLMGTFENVQIQGQVIHNIMRMNGVVSVNDQTHVLKKQAPKELPEELLPE